MSSYFYLGELSLDWFLHIYFLSRYCDQLEQNSFRNRTADFLWMMILLWIMITGAAFIVKMTFLSQSLVFAVTYLWSRRNPDIPMGFFGVIQVKSSYLCWVLLGFHFMMRQAIPWAEVVGLLSGHVYYYFEDVYPRILIGQGRRLFKTPGWLEALFPR